MTDLVEALTFIEVDIPFCARTYGVSPCTATLSGPNPTGTIKCFNTPKTCQDRANYLDAPVTLRFAQDTGFVKKAGIDCIASVKTINFTPAVVSLGKDLGTRASLSVTFRDHPWQDTGPGFDKYRTERPYNPYLQGTFWGKFRARQPFLRGRTMRLIRGFVGQAIGDMETRNFVIDGFTHNTADGTYTITAKDALKLADDDRAQAPRLSNGFLNAAITDADTLLTLQPAGVGNNEYPASGYVAIGGKEICAYSRDETAGNDANTRLLLHFEGPDGSTVDFVDSSASAKTVSIVGSPRLEDSERYFGLSSGVFDGSGDYLFFADHADWTPAGNFTFDTWARWNALAATQYLFTHFTNATNRYFLSVSSAGALTFSVISSGSTIVTMSSSNGAVAADGAWRHIAVVRNGNVWRIYVNGTSVATTTDSDSIPNFTSWFYIGADHAGANNFNGWLDEFRVSRVARWTANFTPPVAAYLTSSDVLSLTRAQRGTEAIAHDASDRAQLVLSYVAQDAADIIRDLLVNYAGVSGAYIPLATWKTETASFLNRVFSADIAEPTGVNKLVSEIIEDGALSLWWDDVASLIRLRVLRAVPTDAVRFDQGNYLAGSFSSREQPNARLSQIWRYFAKRNPLEGQDDPSNYRSIEVEANLDAETDYGGPAIHKIFSRWIPFGGRSIAQKANKLYLSRFRDPPRRVNFATFRDGMTVPVLGQGYRIAGMGIQDGTGAAVDIPIQISRLNPGEARFEIEAEEMLVSTVVDLTNRVIAIDVNTLNINLRALHDTLYPAPTSTDVSNGVTLKCYIDPGVLIGSEDAATAALVVGGWPVGFPITLIVHGSIRGAGGNGGFNSNSGDNGETGGTALYTRFPIDLEIGAGELWGGGGGGGRGSWSLPVSGSGRIPGSGGGGGAGDVPGSGGTGRSVTNLDGTSLADPGQPGTATTGGTGGTAGSNGGNGGLPGQAGTAGQSGGDNAAGTGGAAGRAIDGVSFVTVTVGPGDRRGPEMN